jgi:1-pyrroline-5-carboxylate dehydrogenase
MKKLSLMRPANEPFSNVQASTSTWSPFAEALERVPRGVDVPMVIGGKRIRTRAKIQNINPSTGETLGTIQQCTPTEAQDAINAALAAKATWSALPPENRLAKFRDLEAVLLKWRYETCATAMVECGYTANEMDASWAEMIDFVRFNAYYYTELLSEQLVDGHLETNALVQRPLKGFTCAVTPFNFPVGIGYHLPLVMALTGNTVVWKPSEDATLTSFLLMLALEEAGFPPGVVNMITGDGRTCLPSVLQHPSLSCLNFTGSFATARALGNHLFSTSFERHNFPRFVAETGGKDFLVADSNIDVEETARCIVAGAFGRSGQKCSANSLVFANQDIWPDLKDALITQVNALRMKSPTNQDADLGPVINARAFQRISKALSQAQADPSVHLLAGGHSNNQQGFYVEPTVFEVKTDNHFLLTEEIFGPITAVKTYQTLDEVVRCIQQHHYRLTGAVVSHDESFLQHAVPLLSEYAGNFYINRKTTGAVVGQQPFGGDGASGTNYKAGSKNYLTQFLSPGTITRRHARFVYPEPFGLVSKYSSAH